MGDGEVVGGWGWAGSGSAVVLSQGGGVFTLVGGGVFGLR